MPRTTPVPAGKLQARLGTLKIEAARLLEQLANATAQNERTRLKEARRQVLEERARLKGLLADHAARRRSDGGEGR